MNSVSKTDFKIFVYAILILYIPFHLIEEAYFNWPLWIYKEFNFPILFSHTHWLIGNGFFSLFLLIGLYLYLRDTEKNLFFGYGILIWAFINSLSHILGNIVSMTFSPGIITGMGFLVIMILGTINLKKADKLNIIFFLKSTGAGILYWLFPIACNIALGKYLNRLFPGSLMM